jgi:hypothetical protein
VLCLTIISYWISASLVVALLAAALVTWIALKLYSKGKNPTRCRKMSFMTEMMTKGSYPKDSNIPEPFMNGIIWFENLPKKTDLIEAFRRVLAKHAYGRMRSVIIRKGSQVFFKEISMHDFDLSGRFIQHIVFNEDEIVKSIEELLITGMDDGKPLWEFHLYQSKQGRSAILAKVHHAIGDGISIVPFISNMFKNADGSQFSIKTNKMVSQSEKSLVKKDWKKLIVGIFLSIFKVLSLPTSKFDTPTKLKDSRRPFLFSGKRKLIIGKPVDFNLIKEIKNATKTYS